MFLNDLLTGARGRARHHAEILRHFNYLSTRGAASAM
jgi:hypothetical protein